MPIPDNLIRLGIGERELATKAREWIASDAELLAHLDITERAMDLLDVLARGQVEDDDDGRAIQHLGIRVFNGLASAWQLMSAGYFQVAAMVQRDLVETVALANYFHYFPEQLMTWRCADRKQLVREFGPAQVRKALDAQARMGKSRREAIYYKFCSLAAHACVEGFAMLRPMGMESQVGPFMDRTALKALLEEHGQLAAQAGLAFAAYVDQSTSPANTVTHRFMIGAMDYGNRFLGTSYAQDDFAELDRIYSMARDR
jgi:hypothetical protein